MSVILQAQARKYGRQFPKIRTGYTVRVCQTVVEGGKERTQMFEGLVIAVHKGRSSTDGSFTVRRIIGGIGTEKIYPFCSTNISKIDVVKLAKVRRSKLFFLRNRRGKAARLSERFTTAGEFKMAAAAGDSAMEDEEDEEDKEDDGEDSDTEKGVEKNRAG